MKNYVEIMKGIEQRLGEIGNDLRKQKYPDEVNDLLCKYRTLKEYDHSLDPFICHDKLTISYRLNCLVNSLA